MKIIVCTDNSNGMMFGGKRQSQDSVLRKKILEIIGQNRLFMSEYSSKQFDKHENIHVCNDFFKKATDKDFCFTEDISVPSDSVNEIYLFRWNRDYPADVYFDIDLKKNFKKISTEDFEGSSHKKITLEIYARR